MNLNGILTQFRKFFPSQWINSLARKTGLVQRSSSKFDGADFCQLLIEAVNAPTELSLSSFCKILYKINQNAKIKAKSLWERICRIDGSYLYGNNTGVETERDSYFFLQDILSVNLLRKNVRVKIIFRKRLSSQSFF